MDSFTYSITDSVNGPSNLATVTIAVSNRPTCSDSTATTQMNQPLRVSSFPCDDLDESPDEFGVIFDDGSIGTTELDPVTYDVIFTPPAGFVGTATFPYWAEDQFGLESVHRTMTITVTSPPVATVVSTPVPTATPAPPPKDMTAPAVTLKNTTKKQSVSIELTTNENATAKLTLTLDQKTARKLKLSPTVGTLKAALKSGASKLTVKLSTKAKRAFKKVKKVKLTLTAVVADTAGNATTKTLAVTLRR